MIPSLSVLSVLLAAHAQAPADPKAPTTSETEWILPSGFVVERDAGGFQLPTALAFVPRPGSGPKDPLYFVVELRGKVKVVSNDRTVTTFAEGFARSEFGNETLPDGTAEFGAAGICLDPVRGYVFVTYAYQDEDKLLRNAILRFETKPEIFAARPSGQKSFAEVFRPFKSGTSHQIGPCQAVGDLLYVGVGDGLDSPQGSQRTDTLLGKILRLTVDGAPAPGNPFLDKSDPAATAGYVWAYGLRNPFSLKQVEGHLLAADNGLSTDRFLEIRRGENYLWDGTERSLAINAAAVISPSVGPVQMDYLPPSSSLFPEEYRGRFFVALSGRIAGIMTFDYALDDGKMRRPHAFFTYRRGKGTQVLTGLAFGPDGLYFAPILPEEDGTSALHRIRHDPAAARNRPQGESLDLWTVLTERGCYSCHVFGTAEDRGGMIGPALEREGLRNRLERTLGSKAYLDSLDAIDRLDVEPQRSFRAAREEVRRAQGDDLLRTWIYYRVLEPRFDRVLSAMPNCNVTPAEARLIADALIGKKPPPLSWSGRLARRLRSEQGRSLLLGLLGISFALGLAGGAAAFWWLRDRRR